MRRMALGAFHACALGPASEVRCWGHGGFGQLGPGAGTSDHATPQLVLRGASAVAAGGSTSCAIVRGQVRCWGAGERGQRGDGRSEPRGDVATVASADGALANVVELALGRAHGCARDDEGGVWCWGDGTGSQLGVRPPSGVHLLAVRVLEGAEALSLGPRAGCARTADGWRCWGDNGARQLATIPARPLVTPRPVPAFAGADTLALGARHSCVRMGGAIRCVGASATGALGLGRRRRSRRLADVALPGPALDLAVGPDFSCARLVGGPLCWGYGYGPSPRAPGDEGAAVRSTPLRSAEP